MRTFNKIGVLGGMGPEATVLLMQRVIESISAQDDSDHIPMIIDNHTQVPSRIKAIIEKQGEDPAPVLRQMAQRLEAAGARALVMPCNTAHHYAVDIEAGCSIPLLNMIELTADTIAKTASSSSKVGILASPAVRMTGLYINAFKRRNIEFLHAKDDMKLLEIIKMIKGEGVSQQALSKLNAIANELEIDGATHLVGACTEFSLLSSEIVSDTIIVDSLDVLTQAAVSFATS